jgi:hypothetical protein
MRSTFGKIMQPVKFSSINLEEKNYKKRMGEE